MQTITTKQTHVDHRSAELRFMQDEVPERIFRLGPHLRPDPFDKRTVSKSLLSTWGFEYCELVRSRYPSLRQELHSSLRDLPGMFLATQYNISGIRAHLDRIDAAIHRVEHPEAAPPPWPAQCEVAKDLGVQLPAEFEPATRELARAMALVAGDHPRARLAWGLFSDAVTYDRGENSTARWMRLALVGHGLPAIRKDDRVFAGALPKLPAMPALRDINKIGHENGEALALLEAVGPLLGMNIADAVERQRRIPASERRGYSDVELQRLQRERDAFRLVPDAKPGDRAEANRRAYEEQAAKVIAADRERVAALTADLGKARERALQSVVAAVDAKLANLEQHELGSLRYLVLRDLRLCLTIGPKPPALFRLGTDSDLDLAERSLRQVQTFGVAIEVAS